MSEPEAPRYGLDAPEVMAGLLSAGALSGAASAFLATRRGTVARAGATAAALAGAGAGLLGSAMLAYSLRGKFSHPRPDAGRGGVARR